MIHDAERRSWKAPSLVWIAFEDSTDWVVFNPDSSEIHLINDAAHRLWTLASDGQAHQIEELARALTGEALSKEALDLTGETMAFMDRVGLLQSA